MLSRGPSPTPLNGTLFLEMRRSDISGPFEQLSSWYLNSSSWWSSPGEFSISWLFGSSDVPLPAGPVEVRFQFDADDLNANDQEQFSDIFGIRSFVVFDYTLPPAIRGREHNTDVFLTDHTGSSFASFEGDFNLDFAGDSVWNQTDPDSGRITTSFTPELDMDPGDYAWELSYGGSTWLSPNSTSEIVRVKGLANASATLGEEWTARGSTNWVSGFAMDMVLITQVIGNNSSVTALLNVPS